MIKATVEIAGESYLLVSSLRTMKFAASWQDATDVDDNVEKMIEWVRVLIDAGSRYAKKMGIPNPEPLTKDEIMDYIGADDFERINAALQAAVEESNQRKIEVEPPKQKGKND